MKSFKLKTLATTAIILTTPQQVKADLPVHCVAHQVTGEWNFFFGAATHIPHTCGHNLPDTEDG